MTSSKPARSFVVCVDNRGYPAALEVRKLYRRLVDPKASRMGLMRVVDESGEDYLYPAGFFLPIRLSAAVLRALRRRR
jgi:hypothetical protein